MSVRSVALAVALTICCHGSALPASTEGGRIAYVGHPDTYVTDHETFRYTELLGDDPQDLEPTPHRGAAIYVMDGDGRGRRRVTTGLPSDSDPNWSPDGERLAITRSPPTGAEALWLVDVDTRAELRFTPDDASESQPAWSPDGTRIAFIRYEEGSQASELWVRQVAGGEEVRLTRNDVSEGTPAWSPDGARIVFGRRHPTRGTGDLFIIDADGTNERPLTFWSDDWEWHPDWSPDGRTIAFDRWPGIWVINADGTQAHDVTARIPRGLDFEGGFAPTWSPDGREIAFTAVGAHPTAGVLWFPVFHADFEIDSIAADGTALRTIRDEHGYVALPDWESGPAPPSVAEAAPCSRLQRGSRRDDVLRGTHAGDRLEGGAGDDTLHGFAGDDCLAGQAGDDLLLGASGADRLLGGPGRDRIDARDGARDRVVCGGGRDVARVDAIDRVRGCELVRHKR